MNKFSFADIAKSVVDRLRAPKAHAIELSASALVECMDEYGKVRWTEEIDLSRHVDGNGITNEGLDHVLDTEFTGSAQVSPWYIGLVDNAGFSAFAAADTMSSHAGWAENTNYSESARQEWTEGAAASQSITNAVTVDFSMNATVTIHGIFITSDSTKSGTSGTLWATGAFSGGNQAVNSGDTLKVTYTVNASAV